MSRNTRRLAIASLALGLGLVGTAPAVAEDDPDIGDILSIEGLDGVVANDLPVITGDIEGGLAGLLGGDRGLLGGILGGTGGLLGGILGDLGTGLGPDLSIQPVPTICGEQVLENSRVGAGLLDGLLGIGSITESLAGHL